MRDEIFYLPLAEVEAFWKRMEDGGRKSFTYDEVDKRFRVRGCRDMLVHYLEQIQMDLDGREEAVSYTHLDPALAPGEYRPLTEQEIQDLQGCQTGQKQV